MVRFLVVSVIQCNTHPALWNASNTSAATIDVFSLEITLDLYHRVNCSNARLIDHKTASQLNYQLRY